MTDEELRGGNNSVWVVLISEFHLNIIECIEHPRLSPLVQYGFSILKAALFELDVLCEDGPLFRKQVEF